MVELTRGSVHCKDDVCANGVASIGNRFAQQSERLAVTLADAWCIATFVANSGGVVVCFEDFGKSVEDFGAHAERICKSCCTLADDHKLLDIGRKGGVRTTVENIHHWQGKAWCAASLLGNVAPEWLLLGMSNSLGSSKANAENSISAELRLIIRPVKSKHCIINRLLVARIVAHQCRSNNVVNVGNCLAHPFASPLATTIAQLQCFARTGTCSARDSCSAQRTISKDNVRFDGRVAAAV